MTPFDPVALLVVLLTFYPFVSAFELARAKAERAAYFAGGTIIGSKHDKLQLPDGRVFDCIVGAGTLNPKWGVTLDVPGEPGPPNPYPLEEGPLSHTDPEVLPVPVPETIFETLASEAIGELLAQDDQYAHAEADIGEASDPGPFEAGTEGPLEGAALQLAAEPAVLEAIDPAELILNSGPQDATIAAEASEWDALEVPDIPEAPAPAPAPNEPPEEPEPGEPPVEA